VLAERVCELLPKAQLNDCLASRAVRQAWSEWHANPDAAQAERVAQLSLWAEFYRFDDDRIALGKAIRAWSRSITDPALVLSAEQRRSLIASYGTRYGMEA